MEKISKTDKILKALAITITILMALFLWIVLDVLLVDWLGSVGHGLWLILSLSVLIFYLVYEYCD